MNDQPPPAPSEQQPPAETAPPPPAPSEQAPPVSTGATIPLDADDTRGRRFGEVARHPLTLILGGILILATGGALAAAVGPAVGVASAGGAFLLVLLIVWLVASSRAEKDFFSSYAQGRSLTLEDGRGSLPPVTPLLQRGDSRYSTRALRGALPGGENGTLAHYTYEETTTDSNGDRQTSYFKFTVAMAEVPEMAPFLEEIFFQRRVGFRFLDGAEDVFRKRQRVEQESEVVDKRFEIFCGQNDDLNRARQVLAPTFLVWLGDNSPENFAFECVAGMLVCNVKGHKKSAAELDAFCEGTSSVAKRLREEAME
jgi:hypothetical protein